MLSFLTIKINPLSRSLWSRETRSSQKRKALIQHGIQEQQGRHSITDKTQTGRTGAFKDRVTRELRRHTWDQIKQSDMREKLGHRTGGAKTQQNSPGA